MHTVDVILYIIAVIAFACGFLNVSGNLRGAGINWIALGLLAWVLVPALKLWGV